MTSVLLSLCSHHIALPDLASVEGKLKSLKSHPTDFRLQGLCCWYFAVVSKEHFETTWSAGEMQRCISELLKSGSSPRTCTFGSVLSPGHRKAPGAAALQPWELEGSAFHREFCFQGKIFLLNTSESQVGRGETWDIPIPRGEVWLLWKGAALFLHQLPNSAWSKRCEPHQSLAIPQVVN